jgi:hypothetical protein
MRAGLITILLILGACETIPGSATTTAVTPPTTTTSPGVTEPEPGCPQSVEVATEGRVFRLDQPTSDSGIIGLISWELSNGCESFQIAFETAEGAPSTTAPSVVVEFLDTLQVLRVRLDVDRTAVTDQRIETQLVDRVYAVTALGGGMFMDFHLANPAQALVQVSNSPARLILQLQSGPLPFKGTAALSDRAVVVGPPDGAVGTTNLVVSGYARTFDGSVVIIATAADKVVAETETISADWVETWGEFQTRILVPIGETSIFVGERDPVDGSLSGVTVRTTNR